jgi:molybdenum cofactor synthesis domain-containing protein
MSTSGGRPRSGEGIDPVTELPADARAVVITASNRAAAGVYEDRSGQALADGLRELGFAVEGPHVRPDDVAELEAVLRAAVDVGFDVVLTTGGTGLSPTDVTPEATRGVLDREAPGIAEAIRRYGADNGVPTSVLSRGLAGVAARTSRIHRRRTRRAGRARAAAPPRRQPTAGRRSWRELTGDALRGTRPGVGAGGLPTGRDGRARRSWGTPLGRGAARSVAVS